ncbi:hypothetical protein ACFWAN_00160 [Streptomyces mirabilis]|uniref:hypothetical protein n=1 Tax=Streptomyces mirabilis TaxID=68239 RepID=UPI003666AEAB
MRALAEAALGPDAWIPPLDVAVDDETVAVTAVDVSDFRPHKLRALAAHAGQADAAALLQLFGLSGGEGPGRGIRTGPPAVDRRHMGERPASP